MNIQIDIINRGLSSIELAIIVTDLTCHSLYHAGEIFCLLHFTNLDQSDWLLRCNSVHCNFMYRHGQKPAYISIVFVTLRVVQIMYILAYWTFHFSIYIV